MLNSVCTLIGVLEPIDIEDEDIDVDDFGFNFYTEAEIKAHNPPSHFIRRMHVLSFVKHELYMPYPDSKHSMNDGCIDGSYIKCTW